MALNRLEILVAERGARAVRRSIAGIGSAAKGAQGPVQLLRRTLAVLVAGASIAKLQAMADSFTLIQNRLKIVTKNTAETAVVTEKLFDVANETRTSFQLTAEIYTRTALATRELGRSQEELIQFTETLNKAVILSGAGVLEANNAMIQLSQGLSSNTLRGDELRSVLEQLPVVADLISKHFNTTRGGLRALGEQNKITAKDILDAFKSVREEIDERFAKTLPTIAQAFVIVRNQFIRLIGRFNESTGILQVITTLIKKFGENLEFVARSAGAAAIAIGILLAAQAIPRLILALGALTVAAFANPFTAMLVAVSSLIGVLVAFGDQLQFTETGIANVLDAIIIGFEDLAIFAKDSLELIILSVTGVQDALTDIDFLEVAQTLAVAAELIGATIAGMAATIKAVFSNIFQIIGGLFVEMLEGMANAVISFANFIRETAGETEFFDPVKIENPFAEAMREVGEAGQKAFDEAFKPFDALRRINEFADRVEARAQERFAAEEERRKAREKALADLGKPGPDISKNEKGIEALKDIQDELDREFLLLKLTNRERERRARLLDFEDDLEEANVVVTDSLRGQLEAYILLNQQLSEQADLFEDIKGPLDDYKRDTEALTALKKKGRITEEEYEKALRKTRITLLDTQTGALAGLERGLLKVEDTALDVATGMETALVNTFNNATDAFLEFVKTGKLSFKDLINSLLADLTRLAFQRSVVASLSSLFGGVLGGIAGGANIGGAAGPGTDPNITGDPGLSKLAHGGSFLVGGSGGTDSQLVGFRATPNERVSVETPEQQRENQAGPSIIQNFNIFNPIDPDGFKRSQPQMAARGLQAAERFQRRVGQ